MGREWSTGKGEGGWELVDERVWDLYNEKGLVGD